MWCYPSYMDCYLTSQHQHKHQWRVDHYLLYYKTVLNFEFFWYLFVYLSIYLYSLELSLFHLQPATWKLHPPLHIIVNKSDYDQLRWNGKLAQSVTNNSNVFDSPHIQINSLERSRHLRAEFSHFPLQLLKLLHQKLIADKLCPYGFQCLEIVSSKRREMELRLWKLLSLVQNRKAIVT